jgi:hypothetical protein
MLCHFCVLVSRNLIYVYLEIATKNPDSGGGAEAPVSACVAVSVAVTLGLVVRSFVGFPQGWLIGSFGVRWQARSVPQGRSRPEERKWGAAVDRPSLCGAQLPAAIVTAWAVALLVLLVVPRLVQCGDGWSADDLAPVSLAPCISRKAAVRFGPGRPARGRMPGPWAGRPPRGPRSGTRLDRRREKSHPVVSHGVDLLVSRVLGY